MNQSEKRCYAIWNAGINLSEVEQLGDSWQNSGVN